MQAFLMQRYVCDHV